MKRIGSGRAHTRQRKGRWLSLPVAVALAIGASAEAASQIGMVGASDADWTVLTVASDGAFGTATEGYMNRALAIAIERCRAVSRSALGCGAYQISLQGGWALAMRCGKDNILAKGVSLADAAERARQREAELRRLYYPDLGGCRQLVVVAPGELVKLPQSQAVASGSSRER